MIVPLFAGLNGMGTVDITVDPIVLSSSPTAPTATPATPPAPGSPRPWLPWVVAAGIVGISWWLLSRERGGASSEAPFVG